MGLLTNIMFFKIKFVAKIVGSAGSVIANRWIENPQWKILSIEAGGNPPFESDVLHFSRVGLAETSIYHLQKGAEYRCNVLCARFSTRF